MKTEPSTVIATETAALEAENVAATPRNKPVEECFEVSDTEIEDLPDENIESYPQENAAYFRTKKATNYVRNDKVPLDNYLRIVRHLAAKGVELPPMITIYKNYVGVE